MDKIEKALREAQKLYSVTTLSEYGVSVNTIDIIIEALQEKQMRNKTSCKFCTYYDVLTNEYPCSICKGGFISQFQPKKDAKQN